MELGIMEFTAIENMAFQDAPPAACEVEHYGVYFRDEYFGRVPASLLPDVKTAMASAGGFDCQPDQRTITSLHKPGHYASMCREIVSLVLDHTKGSSELN
ncbi:hypothetical protein [Salmonirosea aquatica]|uniref:Uncharacterized protein n=1 Tax=Salmonirosea aquatica TaxID=2654236 RepID=A0A7C9BLH4_9BACT|nr:hypothetical protein [Cytophagaceae bacterium SJW1-29]